MINQFIVGLNKSNNMYTPLLADTILTNMPGDRPPRVHYGRLTDGVHPPKELRDLWVDKIVKTMRNNRYRRRACSGEPSDDVEAMINREIGEELDRALESLFD